MAEKCCVSGNLIYQLRSHNTKERSERRPLWESSSSENLGLCLKSWAIYTSNSEDINSLLILVRRIQNSNPFSGTNSSVLVNEWLDRIVMHSFETEDEGLYCILTKRINVVLCLALMMLSDFRSNPAIYWQNRIMPKKDKHSLLSFYCRWYFRIC